MKLLTEEIRAILPALGSQEHAKDPTVYVKFFSPDIGWTWYATEGEPEGRDFLFFGYVRGFVGEWGYFRLSELQQACGGFGLAVERDLSFRPCPMSKLAE